MLVKVNVRHLEEHDVHLEGQLPALELDIDTKDPVISVNKPLRYDLQVQKLEGGLLIRGRLDLPLDCECVRCLKRFEYGLVLDDWAMHLPLEGEEAAPIVNDCVDLTPFLREDILLSFPQHPLCNPQCGGLAKDAVLRPKTSGKAGQVDPGSPAWAELNKLKL